MIRLSAFLFVLVATLCYASAQATELAVKTERATVIKALYGAAIALPAEKRERAERVISAFEAHDQARELEDYGWSKAQPILAQGGVDALIRAARQTSGPLRYARTDALLAAGIYLRDQDPRGAERINAALLDLAGRADTFEKVIYAHAAAELAAVRCDRSAFRAATDKTGFPDNLRYAFWRGRMEGDVSAEISRVWDEASSEDTRHVRQAIDGYRLIDQYGYCPSDTSSVAD